MATKKCMRRVGGIWVFHSRQWRHWPAAIIAGVIAGIAATVAQIILWWIFLDELPDILYRDARLTAAIVLGPQVLMPPATFRLDVILVATLIHFAISVACGVVLAGVISRREIAQSLLVGVVFGLILYGINMYGFTLVFPWFSVARGPIAIVTHGVFGFAIAGAYKALTR